VTTPLTLGAAPGPLSVILTPGAAFTAEIDAVLNGTPYTWPVGTTARLVFERGDVTSQTWAGVVVGSAITFTATQVMSDGVPDGSHARLYLNTSGGVTGEFLWLAGSVSKSG